MTVQSYSTWIERSKLKKEFMGMRESKSFISHRYEYQKDFSWFEIQSVQDVGIHEQTDSSNVSLLSDFSLYSPSLIVYFWKTHFFLSDHPKIKNTSLKIF